MPTQETIVPQNQAWPNRAPVMAQLFRKVFGGKAIKAIEIGVWYGIGSTNIWLDNLAEGSQIFLIDSWKPYASEEDINDPGWDYHCMNELSTDAFLSAFLNVRRFEKATHRRNVDISLVRGNSFNILSSMASDQFDFIYIDGDHKYTNAKNDIEQAKRLIKKDFGIICGDDLERLPTPELYDLSKGFPDRDYLREPYNLHPGVLMAVHEAFSEVDMTNGFWWVACINGKFLRLNINIDTNGSALHDKNKFQTEVESDQSIADLVKKLSDNDSRSQVLSKELSRAEAQIELIKELWMQGEDRL